MTQANTDRIKAETRKEAAASRLAASKANPDAAEKLARFAEQLIAEFHPQNIAGYWPIKSELDVFPLLSSLAMSQKVGLCLPITGAPETALSFHCWQLGDTLDIGPYDTRQPFPEKPELVPDLMLLPLLAFDEKLNRLGYGGGFYDRTLASLAHTGNTVMAIGIAYESQKIDKVPVGYFDRPLDGVLTPSELIMG